MRQTEQVELFLFFFFCYFKGEMEVWKLEAELVELGIVTVRNAANYNPVSDAWWPKKRCMLCDMLMVHPFYLGYAFHYTKPLNQVRLMGSGYFCSECEEDSRIIAEILAEWEVLALDQMEWEEALQGKGVAKHPQVFYHYTNWCCERPSSFKSLYNAKKGALPAKTKRSV